MGVCLHTFITQYDSPHVTVVKSLTFSIEGASLSLPFSMLIGELFYRYKRLIDGKKRRGWVASADISLLGGIVAFILHRLFTNISRACDIYSSKF
jgi:hypothetical protein